jgi:uncharacterized RmlC-like cupin family protein
MQQTPGIHRQQAFAGDDRWVGFVRTEPGDWSGWHHHGEHDTYFYVLQGGLEFEYGRDRATIAVGRGDFAHMPGNLIHRERTSPGEPVEAVVIRMGLGPLVVNVDGPTS